MFRPHVTVERYGLISKIFSTVSNNGKAQRSYRLISDRFLSRGNYIIRERDRIVGEISLPNIAANDKYEFTIGQDPDIIYKENIALISSTKFTEEVVEKNRSVTRTRYIYEIHLEIKNFKTCSITIEYEQKGFHSYQSIKLMTSNNNQFIQYDIRF